MQHDSFMAGYDRPRIRRAADENLPIVAGVARLWSGKPISDEIGYGKLSTAARLRRVVGVFALVATVLSAADPTTAADWPMWRHDAGHTATTAAPLPTDLRLLWSRLYAPRVPVWMDPLNRDLMPYDTQLEPIVADGRLFLGFNDQDKVVALDTSTGKRLWTFYTEGPVRFPPVAHKKNVLFTCDDGYLYCVTASAGRLVWKRRGGPSDRKLLGNRRLISTWPARGGPVVADDTVYFAAGIWPFMGTFIYALDAATGEVQWLNDASSSTFIKQPHNTPGFAGVGPQGAMVVCGDRLLVPGGRSVPAVFDRKTGKLKYYHLAKYNKSGGSSVFALGDVFFSHNRAGEFSLFSLGDGQRVEFVKLHQPVLTASTFYSSGPKVRAISSSGGKKEIWSLDTDASGDLIKAGDRLYAGGKGAISVIERAKDKKSAKVAQTIKTGGTVARLVAADDKLFAVTREGRLMAFAAGATRAEAEWTDQPAPNNLSPAAIDEADLILQRSKVRAGYAIVYNPGKGDLAEILAAGSKLHIVVVESDSDERAVLRRRFDKAGLLGSRLAVCRGTPETFMSPPYLAELTVFADHQQVPSEEAIRRVYKSVRPFGGKIWFPAEGAIRKQLATTLTRMKLPRAKGHYEDGALMIERTGAPIGAADWNHQYGSMGNTIKSDDKLVKLPLGVLWFGGNSHADVLPRHGHGPPEQVVAGRLVIQGMDLLSARDVYTGRVLWRKEIKGMQVPGVYFNGTYQDAPLSTAYQQVHIPGANARGTDYVTTADRVYAIVGAECHVLDAATGKTLSRFDLGPPLPPPTGDSDDNRAKDSRQRQWAYIGVVDDILLGGDGFATVSEKPVADKNKDKKKNKGKKKSKGKRNFNELDVSSSAALVAMDRHSGKIKWRIDARHGFIHNAIAAGGGLIYCLDKLPPAVEQTRKRKGRPIPTDYRLLALDAKSGRVVWEKNSDLFGSWLGYSSKHDILLQSTRPSRDTLSGETGTRMITYRASSGEVVWDKSFAYTSPPIMYNDRIITGGKAYYLASGESVYRKDPISGKQTLWSYSRNYGCNYAVASEHMLMFRSSAAGFFDLAADGGTGNFGGFKSGCTSSLVAAGGVLNAPDYTRSCSCSFQNQTSLALIHMPELEMWTHNDFKYDGGSIVRVGVNFGAAGDRRAAGGTLWLEHPSGGAPSPKLPLQVSGSAEYFRHHNLRFSGPGLDWVAASGLQGEVDIAIPLNKEKVRVSPMPKEAITLTLASDDAEEDAAGKVNLNSSDLEMSLDKTPQTVGIRFPSVNVPRGAKIEEAYIQFHVDETSRKPADLMIYGQDDDNAATFKAAKHNVTSRPRTDASVKWKPRPWKKAGLAGVEQRTPNLVSIITAIIARPGWKAGNAMALLVSGKGKHVATSFDGNQSGAPKLIIRLPGDKPRGPLFSVRLYFAEPDDLKAGERVFDVWIGRKVVLAGYDVAKAAGGPRRIAVEVISHVPVFGELKISLKAVSGKPPILSGVEIVAE